MNKDRSAFEKWQARQRELHALEARIAEAALDGGKDAGKGSAADLGRRAQALREEVERLFPLAMEELEANVQRIKDCRPRLHPS